MFPLLVTTPNGHIAHISKVYGGRSSDVFITNDSGFLSEFDFKKDDVILADKGFPQIKISGKTITVIPPRARKGQTQFTVKQMETTKKIASVRIHVERVIQRLKIYKILNHRMSLRLMPHVEKILKVCAVLTNFQAPIIKPKVEEEEEVEQLFDDNSLEAGASGDEGSDLGDDVNTEDSDNE